jgi:hypothetical protein
MIISRTRKTGSVDPESVAACSQFLWCRRAKAWPEIHLADNPKCTTRSDDFCPNIPSLPLLALEASARSTASVFHRRAASPSLITWIKLPLREANALTDPQRKEPRFQRSSGN